MGGRVQAKARPRSWRWIGAGASLVAVLAMASACVSPSAGAATHKSADSAKSGYTIGFSNPQGTQPVLDSFQQALTKAAHRQGIKVTSLNAGLSVSSQVSDIQQFINEKVKAIVVFPLAGPPLKPVLTQARKAGIVVLGYNAVAGNTTAHTNIYPYNADLDQNLAHEGAKLAADYVLGQLHKKGNVLGVGIAAPVPSLHAFIASEEFHVTSGHPHMHWLETVADQSDDIAGAAGPVADALTKYHNNVQAVMAYFDGAAIGASQSLKAAGVHAVVVGQQGNSDGIAAIKSGEISATIDVMPYREALIALAMVKQLVAGKKVPTVVYGPVKLITKKNVSKYVSWSTEINAIAKGKLVPPSKVKANSGS